jgi:hypothetical protein
MAILTLTGNGPPPRASAARRLLLLSGRGEKPARMSQSGTNESRHRLATEQVASMKHPSTRAVFDYWDRKRANRPAPARAEINPSEIRTALGDTFMLAADYTDHLRFRLAGTRVCALFGREIKGEAVAELWSETSRKSIDALLAGVVHESDGVVAGVTARTEDGSETDLELLLLPLAHSGHARIRALGVLAPALTPYWIGIKPIAELTLGTLRHIGDGLEVHPVAPLTPAMGPSDEPSVEDVRLRHGFVVYTGGRDTPFGKRTG